MQTNINKKSNKLEMLLWSIALPGFAHLIIGKYVKGILLIVLEILINVLGNFNHIIVLSFNGRIQEAIEQTDYQWLMFYPCLYFFAIWDAYREAGGGEKAYAYLPLAFSAYFVTVGLIFSSRISLFGYLIGPVWLPMMFLPIGLIVGTIIRWLVLKNYKDT
ncbi:hypothetical protein D7Z54_02495 [Salibacterium salarium]|uniref:Uncharacterized protein n=1 Tax=Salibacterium salarium TaxID=284579 RepID=A0A3R9P7T9_9BACI|nr:hypothetical protein [Salibacterium salarium]RSL34729.1 hypothetical protein D7Z54_02495 [Salibacterium salarium]